jgi:3-keto steroid reductase
VSSSRTTSRTFLTHQSSGLGLSIAKRLCTDFLRTHTSGETVTIIFTTRSGRKSTATLSALLEHLSTLDGRGHNATLRVRFSTAQVDLTNLRSVVALSKHLNDKFPKLDAAIFNAGMGAFLGIDWLNAFKSLAVNWVEAVTHPTFKIQAVGRVAKQHGEAEDIGEVFCANVFGHYYLAHEIVPLLAKGAGRLIWISSLEAYAWAYDTQDLEGRSATHSYESSKRLTDVMALTSNINATKPWADKFFQEEGQERKVKMFTCHPGICATSMVELPLVLWYCMTLAFYIARWLGSPWHAISSHSGANSAVHLALAKEEELAETKAERIKWGSGSDRAGREVLRVTEVEGESGEEWEQMGRETWKQMEELRMSWKARLEG